MYRIVKRIVRTITTVTWSIRWENPDGRLSPEEEITLPGSYSITEEEVPAAKSLSGVNPPNSDTEKSDFDPNQGENL